MDLIFVSMENWDEIWRRNQFVCAELTRRFPDDKILFVGLARDVSNQLRRGKLNEIGAATWTIPDYPQITMTRPLKFLPNSLAVGRKFNDALARSHVRRVAKRLGLRKPALWLNPHTAVHMAGRMQERCVIYDITDDWISLTQAESVRQLTILQDAELCRRADAVIVCSQKLFELKKDLARNLHLIPNGVDADHYRRVLEGEGPLPEAAAQWPRPVLGYTGTIHPDRVDIALVEAVAKRMKCGSIALVGPNQLPPAEEARLKALGNVFFTGSVPYARVPDYMRGFDICITPHRVTPFTESLNPIKLWEYLAAGKPIVSTDVAGFRDYPAFVRIAGDAESFLQAALEARQEDRSAPEARRLEARRHSWQARLDSIQAVLEASATARATR